MKRSMAPPGPVSAWPLFCLTLTALIATASNAAPVLPTGGKVVAGSAVIAAPRAGMLVVDQTSGRAIIDWSSFSIGAAGAVKFDNGAGATLNRVTGSSGALISGLLSGTGSVYLIDPHGVIIGRDGVVKVGGTFAASTLDIADSPFMAAGDLTFAGASNASVVNYGRIGALGGDVSLIAATVENAGSISAANGTAGLAAGYRVLLRDKALNGGKFAVLLGGAHTSVTNAGVIAAADAELRANGGNIYALAGNTGGVISATGVKAGQGHVWLIAEGGTLDVAGTISATGAKGSSGSIETSGQTVNLGHAAIDAHGGTWLLDPDNLEITAAAASTISSALATSDVTEETTASSYSGSGVVTSGAGNITLDPGASIAWTSSHALTLQAYNNLILNGTISLGAGTLNLNAGGSIAVNAPITVTGAGAVNLNAAYETVDSDSILELSFGAGGSINYGATNTGGSLKINGQAYTLLYKLSDGSAARDNGTDDIAGIDTNTAAGGDSGYYALATDVTQASGVIYTTALAGGFGGDQTHYIRGVFEGLGNTVTGLTIVDPTDGDRVGLFSNLFGTIRDLGVINESVTLTSARSGDDEDVAGLLANSNGILVNDYTTGLVIGSEYGAVGGLLGVNYGNTLVLNSYSTSQVRAGIGAWVGGLVGANQGGEIVNSYATGAVTGGGESFVGGLTGQNTSLITQAFATGAVSGGSGAEIGGLVGLASGGTITAGYYDANTTGQPLGAQSDGSVGLTTAQLQAGLPSGFSTSVWGQAPGAYPYLLTFGPPTPVTGAVSGTVFGATPGSVLSGVTVEIVLNGSTVLGTATTGSGGTYSLTVPAGTLAVGDTITVYLMDGTLLANTVAEAIGGIKTTGLNLIQNALLVQTPDGSLSSMEAGLASGVGSGTPGGELLFGLSGGALTLKSGAGLDLSAIGGAFAFNQGLNIGSGVLDIMAAGVVSQTAGTITAGDLLGYSHGGVSFTVAGDHFAAFSGWSDAAGTIAVSDAQALLVNGAVNGGSAGVSLASTGTVSESGAVITTPGMLSITAVGGATLTGANQVGSLTLANTGGGAVSFANAAAFSAASVSNAGGGAVNLATTAGALTITGLVAGGVVTLASAAGISESGSGSITATNLTGAAGGSVALGGANSIGVLDAFAIAGGSLSLNDGQALLVDGAVSAGGPISLVSSGAGSESGSGAITTPGTLSVTTVGGTALNGANTVGSLALANTGGGVVSFSNAGAFNAALVSNAGGGAVNLATTSGALTLGGPITGDVVTLASAGGITESGSGAITATTLAGSAGGSVSLDGANQIADLGAFSVTGGGLSLADAQSLAIADPVSASGNVTLATSGAGNITLDAGVKLASTSSSALTLQAADNLILNGSISLASGVINLAAVGSTAVNAPITVSGAGSVNLRAGDETILGKSVLELSFGAGASINYGATDNGGKLHINGQGYTLLYALSDGGQARDSGTHDIAGIQNNIAAGGLGGRYALASDLTQSDQTVFAQALVGGAFYGLFEGLGHTITGLTIVDPTPGDQAGLFATVEAGGATVRDLNLVGGSVRLAGGGANGAAGGFAGVNNGLLINDDTTGAVSGGTEDAVGGLAGVSATGAIANAWATGPVSGVTDVGGLVGEQYGGGGITQSYATGAVSGETSVGGLVGYLYKAAITLSYASGTVHGRKNVGGLVGYASADGLSITQSYATGAVAGAARSQNVGGLIGYEHSGSVTNAYATGSVTGTANVGGLVGYQFGGSLAYAYAVGPVSGSTDVGGLVGRQSATGSVTASYWNTQTSDQSAGLGAGAGGTFSAGGLTTAQMQDFNTYATTYAGWDFTTIWSPPKQAGQNGSATASYPKLRPD
jgi:filamentous hemagglutinin family protein